MSVVSMNYLLEAGVHFGHQTKRWNPKMKEYIFSARDDIYIIDLQKTAKKIEEAYEIVHKIIEDGGKVLFVGTKKQASIVVKEEAERSSMYYVNERWLGGTLTNFKTIRERITRLTEIELMEQSGTFDVLPKKEVIKIKKEYDKLNKYLCGIREMKKVPEVLIIIDPRKEYSAIMEARRLNIPVIGIVDTNCDPDLVDYVIPGNDDAVRSIKVILGVLTNAIIDVNGGTLINYVDEEVRPIKKERKHDKEEPQIEEVVIENETNKIEEEPIISEEKEVKEETDLTALTVTKLKEIAKEKDIKGYSKMKKEELIENLK